MSAPEDNVIRLNQEDLKDKFRKLGGYEWLRACDREPINDHLHPVKKKRERRYSYTKDENELVMIELHWKEPDGEDCWLIEIMVVGGVAYVPEI